MDLRHPRRPSRSISHLKEDDAHINGAKLSKEVVQEGAFENFPEITPKTVEILKKRGINFLFPVQHQTFKPVMKREDLIVRDLTGSGKTLGYALPMVEYFRKNKCLGTGKI